MAQIQHEAPSQNLPSEKRESFMKRHQRKIIVAGTAISAAIVVPSGIMAYRINSAFTDGLTEPNNPNASAPQVPGPDTEQVATPLEPYEVSDELAATMWDTGSGMSYEELMTPAELTSEQVVAWESGDPYVQNAIASEIAVPRLEAALLGAINGSLVGQAGDFSNITSDPEVVSALNESAVVPALERANYYGIESGQLLGAEICLLEAKVGEYDDRHRCFQGYNDYLKKTGNNVNFSQAEPINSNIILHSTVNPPGWIENKSESEPDLAFHFTLPDTITYEVVDEKLELVQTQ